MKLKNFIKDIFDTTIDDLNSGGTVDGLLTNTVEELGEYAGALTVEKGLKNKVLKESSMHEAVDLLICAFSLFKASGGTLKDFKSYGQIKLAKWKKRVKDRS